MDNNLFNKIRKLNFISEYNVKKGGILLEAKDATGWTCIGVIPDVSLYARPQDLYIMLSPDAPDSYDTSSSEFFDRYIVVNTKKDGSGNSVSWYSVPTSAKYNMYLFPEFHDRNVSVYFLGPLKTKEDYVKHEEFMKLLEIDNGKVLLKHDSPVIIKDGVIYYGQKQGYSNNSDIGIYFWGTKKIGIDPSNNNQYRYFCHVDINDIYDFKNNLERYRDITQAWKNHKYVANFWKETNDVIHVNCDCKTPISYVLDKMTGKYYDSEWNEINKRD